MDSQKTVIHADKAVTGRVREAIATSGGVVFEQVIEDTLLARLIERAATTPYHRYDLRELGVRANNLTAGVALPFCVVLGRPALMAWLEDVAGCGPINHVEGHLAQMEAGHAVEWHRDSGYGVRRLAMVLNLSTQAYEGGVFQLRRKSTGEPLLAYQASTPGSLAVFRIEDDLQHRVTPVTGGGPRTALAAWARGPLSAADETRKTRFDTWPPLALPPDLPAAVTMGDAG